MQLTDLQVTGDGSGLANDLAPNNTAHLAALPERPVGGVYAPTIETHNITHQTILNLIHFYNEDFDIEQGDHIGPRAQKVRQWLITDF
jgi:hypothetical protein